MRLVRHPAPAFGRYYCPMADSNPVSETLDRYRRATDTFDAVIRAVPAHQWEAQSPCELWKAIDVAGHGIGIQWMIAGWAETGEQPAVDWSRPRDMAGPDPLASWVAACERTTRALTPEALERTIPSRLMGDVPLRQLLQLFIIDTAIHSWDLGTATGQEVHLDPDLVSQAFALVRAAPADMLRSPGGFGPELTPPEGADEQARLLAFLGRKVA